MEQGSAGVKLEEEMKESQILKDVTAYVDVFSSKDSRSKSVTQVLEQLGATVRKKFTDNVTHVIYKEGTQKTLNKARKTGVHLLSVLWVDSCKQNQEHVPEKLFPANLPDDDIPHFFLVKRKRPKCRRPQELVDELADLAKKPQKMQARNWLVERWKETAESPSPCIARAAVLVEDTQPSTPDFSSPACNSPIRLAVPEMTPGMKAKLASLQKARLLSAGKEYLDSPVSGKVCESLQRRLFSKPDVSSDMLSSDADEAASDEAESSGLLLLKSDKSCAGQKTESPTNKAAVKSKTATRRLLSLKENSPMILGQESGLSLSKGYTCSPLFLQGSKGRIVGNRKGRGKKRKEIQSGEEWEGNSRVTKMSRLSQSVNSESPVPSKQTAITDYSMADVVRSGPCTRKSRRKTITAPGSVEPESDSTETRSRVRTTRRQSCGSLTVTPISRHKTGNDLCLYKEDVTDQRISCSTSVGPANKHTTNVRSTFNVIGSYKTEGNSQPIKSTVSSDCDVSCEPVVPQKGNNGSLLGLSMSVAYQDSVLSSTFTGSSLAPPKPSIDEFQLGKKRLKHRAGGSSKSSVGSRDITRGAGSNIQQAEVDSGNSSGSGCSKADCQFVKPVLVDAKRKQQGDSILSGNSSAKSSDGSDEEKNKMGTRHFTEGRKAVKKNGQKPKRSIVMTSLHTPEQELMVSVVKELYNTERGQFYMRDVVSEDTTHVVCGDGRRTLNVLYAIARGCWLLSYTWVLQSLEAGRWLDEEMYELREDFPAAKLSRQECQCSSGMYKKIFFSSVGQIFICKKTKPPRENLVSLVQLCGGQVTTCRRKASVVVGTEFHPDVISVSPQWILDTITEFKLQPYDRYLTCGPKRQSSPEF
ncbi:microcephalin-like [Liolophura sinensis]|uniref:microcephalin-like n=1 Tax=Liolophura sinensis TaxID=3198878 RepID=UPI003158CF9F